MLRYLLNAHAYYGGRAVALDTPAGPAAALYFEEKEDITCLDPLINASTFPYLCAALSEAGKPVAFRLPVGLQAKAGCKYEEEAIGMACPIEAALSQAGGAFLPITME